MKNHLDVQSIAGNGRSRLNRIKNLEGLAHASRYSVRAFAKQCGVSARQIERYFRTRFGQCPHAWLHEVRMKNAAEFLKDAMPLKELIELLGYKSPAHFTHDFKKYHGVTPSNWRP